MPTDFHIFRGVSQSPTRSYFIVQLVESSLSNNRNILVNLCPAFVEIFRPMLPRTTQCQVFPELARVLNSAKGASGPSYYVVYWWDIRNFHELLRDCYCILWYFYTMLSQSHCASHCAPFCPVGDPQGKTSQESWTLMNVPNLQRCDFWSPLGTSRSWRSFRPRPSRMDRPRRSPTASEAYWPVEWSRAQGAKLETGASRIGQSQWWPNGMVQHKHRSNFVDCYILLLNLKLNTANSYDQLCKDDLMTYQIYQKW